MAKSSTFSFMTRRQVAQTLKVPQRMVDQWIATGVLTPIRMSMGLGRGGQRVFYKSDEVKKLKRKRAIKIAATKTSSLPSQTRRSQST